MSREKRYECFYCKKTSCENNKCSRYSLWREINATIDSSLEGNKYVERIASLESNDGTR